MNVLSNIAFSIAFLCSSALAEQPLFADEDPVLLAVTVTEFTKTYAVDGDAMWFIYEANVNSVVAGNFTATEVKFALLDVPGIPRNTVDQFVTLLDVEGSPLGDGLKIRYMAVEINKIEETVCFTISPAEVFPDDPRFKETVTVDSPGVVNNDCYKSETVLANNDN